MQSLRFSVYPSDDPRQTALAESLGSLPILPWRFYQRYRADVLGGTEHNLQMDPKIWFRTHPATRIRGTEGATLLNESEITAYLKKQSESGESGKIFVVIPEDVSTENVVVGIKRD